MNFSGPPGASGEVMGGIDPRMTITILQAEVSRLKGKKRRSAFYLHMNYNYFLGTEENQRVNAAYQDALLSVGSVRLAEHKREEDNVRTKVPIFEKRFCSSFSYSSEYSIEGETAS
jgi:hypothetical protein